MPVISPTVAATSLSPSGGPGVAGTSGGSLSVPYPAVLAGQVLLLCAVNGAPAVNSTPSPWTILDHADSASSDTAAALYWKVATGSETGSVAITHTAGGTADVPVGAMVALSNVASASQITSHGVSSTASGSTSVTTSPAPPTLSPIPNATDLVLRFYCASVNSPGAMTAMGTVGGTWTTNLRQYTNNASLYNCGITVGSKIGGTDSQTITCAPTSGWVILSVAVAGLLSATTDKFMPFFV